MTHTDGEWAGMVGWPGDFRVGERPAGIHPTAFCGGPPEHRGWKVGDPVSAPQIASSALIHAFCTVDAGMTYRETTTIGERTFLQARVHVGHNSIIGDDCEICVGTTLGGEVTIGDGVRIGGNTWVKPLVVIEDGAIIGGGSVVTRSIPAHEVWCGNPARFLKLAWTHPQMRGLEGRQKVGAQYGLTDAEWEETRRIIAAGAHLDTHIMGRKYPEYRYPTVQDRLEYGQGALVNGDFA